MKHSVVFQISYLLTTAMVGLELLPGAVATSSIRAKSSKQKSTSSKAPKHSKQRDKMIGGIRTAVPETTTLPAPTTPPAPTMSPVPTTPPTPTTSSVPTTSPAPTTSPITTSPVEKSLGTFNPTQYPHTVSPTTQNPTISPTTESPVAEANSSPTTPPTGSPVAGANATVYFNDEALFLSFSPEQCESFSNINPNINDLTGAAGFESCLSVLSASNPCPWDEFNSARADNNTGYTSLLSNFNISFQSGYYYIVTPVDTVSLPPVTVAGNGEFTDHPEVFFSPGVKKVSMKLFYESDSGSDPSLDVYGAGNLLLANEPLPYPMMKGQFLDIGIVATQDIGMVQIKDSGGEAFAQLCFSA